MMVMAGKFSWNIERWREASWAQLARRAGAAPSPSGLGVRGIGRIARIFKSEQKWNHQRGAARERGALAASGASAMKARVSPLKARGRRSPERGGYCWPALARLPPHRRRSATAANPPAKSPGVKECVEVDDLRPIAAVDANE